MLDLKCDRRLSPASLATESGKCGWLGGIVSVVRLVIMLKGLAGSAGSDKDQELPGRAFFLGVASLLGSNVNTDKFVGKLGKIGGI